MTLPYVFFKEFYSSADNKKLTLDRAAQDLAKLDKVNFALIKYLVTLHEVNLIDFDEMLRLYRKGLEFIEFDHLSTSITVGDIRLKVKKQRQPEKQIRIYDYQYFIYAFIAVYPLFFLNNILNILQQYKILSIFNIIGVMVIAICFMNAVISLFDAAALKAANDFIKKLKSADDQFQRINS